MSANILKNVVYVGGAGAAAIGMSAGQTDAQGMEGFYGGLSFGTALTSDIDGIFGPDYSFDFQGGSGGIFAGYNVAIGDNWFVGGELSYTQGFDLGEDGPFGPDPYGFADLEDIFDARIRFGTTFDRASVYTAFGVTMAQAPNFVDSGKGSIPRNVATSGLSIGVGMEYALSENFFLGGEVVHRQFQAELEGFPGNRRFPGADLTTLSVRAGFRF